VEGNLLRQSAKFILFKIPWLRRRAQRTLWRVRAGRAYKQRSQDIQRLLEGFSIKPQKISGPKHILFIVVDCLRKDHLSLYGYDRETTPFLRYLSDKAAVFENTFAPSSWTYPSVASILTGFYPHKHGGMHSEDPRNFDSDVPNVVNKYIVSLPELLATFGFESSINSAIDTAALSCIGWFKNSFVFFSDVGDHLQKVSKWLKKNREKNTFVYVQLGDLHEPLNPPEQYRDSFGKISYIPKLDTWDFCKDAVPGELSFELYRENREKLYDCAIRYIDTKITMFFNYLKREGILDSSLIFITSDHGEELWDHVETERELFYDPRDISGVGHGHNLFQELINVPLICVGPGITAGRYKHNVSLVNLVPTVLDICGIQHKLTLDGQNLFDNSDGRVVLSEAIAYGYEKKAIIKDNWKLIHSEGDGVSLLFDLSKDPKEKHDLVALHPDKVAELKALLPKEQVTGETLEVDRDVQEQLRQLGYIE
jgi:arylsulfatase A-like enzyme